MRRRARALSIAAPASSLGDFAGFREPGCDFLEAEVEALRSAPQDVEGLAGGNVLAFHENALGLPDDVAAAQRAVQRGFTPTEVRAVAVEPGGDGEVGGDDGAEIDDFRVEVRTRRRRRT